MAHQTSIPSKLVDTALGRITRRYVSLLGLLIVVYAAGQFAVKMNAGGRLLEATIDFLLLGFAGTLVFAVGRWASRAEIDPDLYPRIVGWCLGGIGVMVVFLFLRAVHPGVDAAFSFGTRAIAITIGSTAGIGIAIHEAQSITRERQLARQNEDLVETRERLERRNEELVRARAELERTVQELEASNELLDQFASTAAHDLREPLRMVTQYLDLLGTRYADVFDDDAAEFLDFATDGATRMQAMVNNLLDYARIGESDAEFGPVDLDAVLDVVVTDLQVRIEERGARITADELPTVEGDAGLLRQLFQNLLGNAIEYCGEEPPRVHVSAERTGSTWTVAVRDEGIGIDPDYQDGIFQLFERLHARDEHEGSGIGLALCRRIVERHGGDIWVDSVPGDGATFSFTLPPTE